MSKDGVTSENDKEVKKEMKRTITKGLLPVTTWMSDEEWLHVAQSCEHLLPGENVTMRVRRFVKESNQETVN